MGFTGPDRPSSASSASIPGDVVVVGTDPTEVIDAGDALEVFIQNDDDANVVYLSLGGEAAVNSGIRLGPGAGIVNTTYTGKISAVSTGADTNVLVAAV